MRNLIFVALLTACSTSKITKTVETIDSAKVGLQRKAESQHTILTINPLKRKPKWL